MGTYAVIGSPVSHSLSPLIHNANFAARGRDDEYLAIEVEPRALDSIREIVLDKKLKGFNVTLPHKESIMKHLDEIEGDAGNIGAVNTVSIQNGVWRGHNTDVTGYMNAFHGKFGRSRRKVLIIGAGGAAKAVHRAHANIGDDVTIAARRSAALEGFITADFSFTLLPELTGREAFDVVINSTPIGLGNEDLAAVLNLPQGLFGGATIGVDLIYKPEETPFLGYFKEENRMNGMPMLIHQAMDAYRIWTGDIGDHEAVNKKYKEYNGGQS